MGMSEPFALPAPESRRSNEPGHDLGQARFRTLAEAIPQLVWLSCNEGLWTWASPQWLDYTGQRQEESHGRGWMDAIHPDDLGKAREAWHEARAHGLLDAEYRLRRVGDGAWRLHHTRSYPIRGRATADQPEGAIVEWVGTCTDVEDQRHR